MISEPKVIHHALHPFVGDAYITEHEDKTKVLVVKPVPTNDSKERSKLYMDFLANLDIISDQMKKKGEKFDRVDIRFPGTKFRRPPLAPKNG